MSGDPSEYSVVAEALKRFGRPELLSLAKVAELRNDVLPLITAEQLASLAGLPLGVAVHIVASVASSTAAGASTTAGATAAAALIAWIFGLMPDLPHTLKARQSCRA